MNSSVMVRAVLALVMMVLFYLLALAIAGASAVAGIGIVSLGIESGVSGKMALLMGLGGILFGVAALVVLWSIVPRIDRFVAPGVLVERDDYPELFSEIALVANAMEQPLPAQIFLMLEPNAFVSERGGWMGFGSKRVMGIGLPLLEALTVSEFRAVLGHEFAHYCGGDTRLGHFIYKTRRGVGRTIQNLAQAQDKAGSDNWLATLFGIFGLVRAPLSWFGRFFLVVSQAVSRRQEFAADARSAKAFGREAMVGALRSIDTAAIAFDAFVDSHLDPIVGAGHRPPCMAGFRVFRSSTRISDAIGDALAEQNQSQETSLYDSHPPTEQRIAAIEALAKSSPDVELRSAHQLIPDIESIERRLVTGELEAISWNDTTSKVFLPAWRSQADEIAESLSEATMQTLTTSPRKIEHLASDQIGSVAWSFSDSQLLSVAESLYGCLLVVRLAELGYHIRYEPGELVEGEKEGLKIQPFEESKRYVQGDMDSETWIQLLKTHSIPSNPLQELRWLKEEETVSSS